MEHIQHLDTSTLSWIKRRIVTTQVTETFGFCAMVNDHSFPILILRHKMFRRLRTQNILDPLDFIHRSMRRFRRRITVNLIHSLIICSIVSMQRLDWSFKCEREIIHIVIDLVEICNAVKREEKTVSPLEASFSLTDWLKQKSGITFNNEPEKQIENRALNKHVRVVRQLTSEFSGLSIGLSRIAAIWMSRRFWIRDFANNEWDE